MNPIAVGAIRIDRILEFEAPFIPAGQMFPDARGEAFRFRFSEHD